MHTENNSHTLLKAVWDGIRLGRRIGLSAGLSLELALRDRDAKATGTLVEVSVPGLRAPMFVRTNSSDIAVLRQTFIDGQYDISANAQFRVLTDKYNKRIAGGHSPLIIDCGANVGFSAIWFANIFPGARIFAVEPEPENFHLMQKNLQAYPNVTLLNGAVWDSQRPLSITNADAEAWAFKVGEVRSSGGQSNEDELLKTYTIPDIMSLAGSEDALIVKIDIEGGEEALFRSNTDWVNRVDLLIIELHDWMIPRGRTSANFLRVIAKHDVDILQRNENLYVFLYR